MLDTNHQNHDGSNQRQHGWIEFKLQEESESTVAMTLPMVYTEKGYTNNLEINLENIIARTSVNDSEILNVQRAKVIVLLLISYNYKFLFDPSKQFN